MAQTYTIADITCEPGTRTEALIPIARSTHGTELGIPVIILHGETPGPALAIQAGIHGDEYDGMEAVRRVLATTDPRTLRGTLIGIPCVNTPAFDAAARTSGLDHANLNRIFPGDPDGSFSHRLAATYLDRVVPAIDALVDLHTGGTFGDITPLTIVQGGFEHLATDLGLAAGHEYIWKGGSWGGTARISALQAGKPAITIEAGGATYRESIAELHIAGVQNIMRSLGMIDGEPQLRDSYTAVTGTFARSAHGGFFVHHADPGDRCKSGDLIATVTDHYGHPLEEVRAPQDGVVLWRRAVRTVQPGDEVVIFGAIEGEIRP